MSRQNTKAHASASARPLFIVLTALITIAISACGGGGGSSSGPPPIQPPTITTQPQGQTVNAGSSATFTVGASGAASYQWKRNGQSIAGATSASYTLSPATSGNNGDSYAVVVSNGGGSVTSASAALRVTGISVLAGQIGGIGFADGPAAQARFWGPAALAFDAAGNLLVADYNTVRKITPAGNVSTVVGSFRTCGDGAGQGTAALLCYPFSLATDASGNVYVADGQQTVWRIDPADSMTSYAGVNCCVSTLTSWAGLLYVGLGGGTNSLVTLNTPAPGSAMTLATLASAAAGLALDGAQNVYVAGDTIVQQVSAPPASTVSTIAGTLNVRGSTDGQGAAAQFGCAGPYPQGSNFLTGNGAVAIATVASGPSMGLSYVADYCNNTIRTATGGGLVRTFVGTAGAPGAVDASGAAARFYGPAALALDAFGNLYVADYLNGLIRKVSPAGGVSTFAGQMPHAGYVNGPAAQAEFRYPLGIVADAAGDLFVCDADNFVIRKITVAGVVSTVAGTPGVPGLQNGPAGASRFARPQGIAIDSAGNLYVADSLNNVLREVTSAGQVTSLAGPFNQPRGVAIDQAGDIYVTDLSGILRAPAHSTTFTRVANGRADAITVGPNNAVYVVVNDTVYSLSSNNTLVALASGFSTVRAPGMVVAGDGNLYVSDLSNSVIKQVTPSGTVTVVVGTPSLPMGTAPGGLPARINSPAGIALLSSGSHVSLAVVDSYEHAVLRVDLP
jgi:sugar lactone lactonase YvrE